MLSFFWPVAYLVLLVLSIYFLVAACVYAFRAYAEIAPDRQGLSNILPFLVLVVPGFLNPAGEHFRKRFIFNTLLAAVFGGGAAMVMYLDQ